MITSRWPRLARDDVRVLAACRHDVVPLGLAPSYADGLKGLLVIDDPATRTSRSICTTSTCPSWCTTGCTTAPSARSTPTSSAGSRRRPTTSRPRRPFTVGLVNAARRRTRPTARTALRGGRAARRDRARRARARARRTRATMTVRNNFTVIAADGALLRPPPRRASTSRRASAGTCCSPLTLRRRAGRPLRHQDPGARPRDGCRGELLRRPARLRAVPTARPRDGDRGGGADTAARARGGGGDADAERRELEELAALAAARRGDGDADLRAEGGAAPRFAHADPAALTIDEPDARGVPRAPNAATRLLDDGDRQVDRQREPVYALAPAPGAVGAPSANARAARRAMVASAPFVATVDTRRRSRSRRTRRRARPPARAAHGARRRDGALPQARRAT